jgi:hypothetical protein
MSSADNGSSTYTAARGCADEDEQPGLHVRQERVLLRLVEAVHLVDEHHGRLTAALALGLCSLDRVADVLHTAEHRRDGDEFEPEGRRHQPRQRGLADARRPPQNHRVRSLRCEGHAQRLVRPEQMLLADHLVDRLRSQALGQRNLRRSSRPLIARDRRSRRAG